jgi:hypothetical protein
VDRILQRSRRSSEESLAMGAIQHNHRPQRENRPMLADAPAWFNQARARSNQRQTFRPVPLPQRRSWIRGAITWLKSSRQNAMLAVALLVAFPAIFFAGFWARSAVSPEPQSTAAREAARSGSQQPAKAHDQEAEQQRTNTETAAQQVVPAQPAAAPAVANVVVNNVPRETVVAAAEVRPSHPEPVASLSKPVQSVIAASREFKPAAVSEDAEAEHKRQLASGFDLTPAGQATLVADVRLPGKSWFETAADEPNCESGLCAPVPKKSTDRKLDTALVWNSSPEAAADEARRDGKLVFLIHVSGNFAQPGFT